MKVSFLIRSLDVGGAERQLAYLARGLKENGVPVSVAVFYRGGELEELLLSAGVPVIYLEKKGRWDLIGFFQQTRKWIQHENPDVLHGYLTGANIVAVMMKPFFRKLRIVWGVRASNMKLANYDRLARLSFRLSSWLSRFSNLIIVNSCSGYDYHIKNDYPSDRMVVVPNGIDASKFKPDLSARKRQRRDWGIDEDVSLVGIIGRLDPMKDHRTFLRAASKILTKKNEVQFVCVGYGNNKFREDLQEYSMELGISENVHWEPGNKNVENVYNALDVLVSTSAFGEGFSNTLAEAMACGVRCVATDVGDARKILSNTGVIVTPGKSTEVADGVLSILDCDESKSIKFKKLAVENISKNYSIDRLVSNTLKVLKIKKIKDLKDLSGC